MAELGAETTGLAGSSPVETFGPGDQLCGLNDGCTGIPRCWTGESEAARLFWSAKPTDCGVCLLLVTLVDVDCGVTLSGDGIP